MELFGGRDGDGIQTVTSKITFHHYFMKCVLTCSGKQLPKWAYEQQEIACNPTSRDPNSMWNIEDNFYPKLPNVSFQNFAPGFISRFIGELCEIFVRKKEFVKYQFQSEVI